YLGNKTQKQVADMLNVSQMQVSRMERKILSKLAMVYKK
ncbi:MAG: sigma factor-like helix-turn-helix DNA-binding protein, partial [Christensenella sp.]